MFTGQIYFVNIFPAQDLVFETSGFISFAKYKIL